MIAIKKPTATFNPEVEIAMLRRSFQSKGQTRQTLAALTKAGCPEETILHALYYYCGGDPQKIRMEKRTLAPLRQRLIRLSDLLSEAADEIPIIAQRVSEAQIKCYFTPDPDKLRAYAELLQKVADTVYKELASARFSGRDHHLIYLIRSLERTTGRPHYEEVATLINATRLIFRDRDDQLATAGSVRQLVRRRRGDYEF